MNDMEKFDILTGLAAIAAAVFSGCYLLTGGADALVASINGPALPVHLEPSVDAPEIDRIVDPDCSTIDHGSRQHVVDADDNRWYRVDAGWVRAGTWCH